MVPQRRAVSNLLGGQQEEVDNLWRAVYRCLSLEQASRPFSQHGSLDGHPFSRGGQKDARLG